MRRRPSIQQAFDEARYGAARILNVRDSLPTGAEGARRADAWLRAKQVENAAEVLIITGRGAGSIGHVPVVRESVRKVLFRLRREGVVSEIREHTPGSFAVRLAPLRSLIEAPQRRGNVPRPETFNSDDAPVAGPQGLEDATRLALRRLALRSLESLGLPAPADSIVASEMQRQFSLLARGAPDSSRSESWLRTAIARTLREYEESER
jgi:hypothetical protein